MVTANSEDALIGSRFAVELDGMEMSHFQAVSGFSNESEVTTQDVSTSGGQVERKLPGKNRWSPITLSRGLTSDMAFWEWRQQAINEGAQAAHKNGSIVMFNQAYEEVARYNFTNAWPSKWTGPAASADDASVVFEEIEIQIESMERVK